MTQVLALYARVSSERQAQEGTIESQLAYLREYAQQHGYEVEEDLIFIDNGVSGASLIRPALEALRDKAFAGAIDKILVLCPDRLARKYAHQLILVEEFEKLGVEILFTNRQLTNSPEDQLLFQIQGVISEFEREKIIERSRRGKLHQAKKGKVAVMSGAPYGYVYIRATDHEDARWEIHEQEAQIVRRIYHMYAKEDVRMWRIMKILNQELIPTRHGINPWCRSVIWQILSNPAYTGNAAYRKTQSVPRNHFRVRPTGEKYPKIINSSRRARPKSEWFIIQVPAIINQDTFDAVQRKLEENKKFSPRNNKKHRYLANGLLRCKECGYAYYGMSRGSKSGHLLYYRCHGTNSNRHAGGRKCWSRPVRVDILDDMVWEQTQRLIKDPQIVFAEYENRLNENRTTEDDRKPGFLINRKRKELRQTEMEKERILDLYQSGILQKGELENRIQNLRSRVKSIESELTLLEQESKQKQEKLRLIERLEEFTKRIDSNLEAMSFEQKKELIRLLISEVVVDRQNHQIDVRHIVPLPQNGKLCLSGAHS